jgi:DNA-directed RNA polymerase specialized sigma24 family protein
MHVAFGAPKLGWGLACSSTLLWALVVSGTMAGAALGQERPTSAVLLDRLCDHTLRPNEEDRLMGTISLTVRATIKYQEGVFSPDLIDDAVQGSSLALAEACPKIIATDDPHRLGMVIDIARDTTLKLLGDNKRKYSPKQLDKATAADLSEELSTHEIDAWLAGLPPRQRALALFLYASDVTPKEVAARVGMPPEAMAKAVGATKQDLLRFFRAEPVAAAATANADAAGPAMAFSEAGQPVAGLLPKEAAPPAKDVPAAMTETAPAKPTARREKDGARRANQAAAPAKGTAPTSEPSLGPPGWPSMRITGISGDVYAGWSLLATVTGLPPDQTLGVEQPILLEPDASGRKRMIVTGAAEISNPGDKPRRFLLKAYGIDADNEGAGLRDGFHLGAAAIANAEALRTLRNGKLSSIETARCLWHDYGGADPGLCR